MTTLTTEEIMFMAMKSGCPKENALANMDILEAFAKLVAEKKHQELYRLAEDAPVRGDARQTRQNILHAIRGKV